MTASINLIEPEPFYLPAQGFVRPTRLLHPHGPLPISRSTLYAWEASGVLPPLVPIGVGRIRGFRVEDIRAFLAEPKPFAGADKSGPGAQA